MGLFDWVIPPSPLPCRKCGATLTGLQSKDGDCAMEEIPAERVHRFYAHCDACKTWNEFKVTATAVRIDHDEDAELIADRRAAARLKDK